jgi:hypothetical protein
MSDKSSEREDKSVLEDNLYGVVQRIRQGHVKQQAQNKAGTGSEHLPGPGGQLIGTAGMNVGMTPSLLIETPVLKPPPHTLVIV